MVRTDRGVKWTKKHQSLPEFGTFESWITDLRLVLDHSKIPGPADYELERPHGSEGVSISRNRAPRLMERVVEEAKQRPGPADYSYSDPINIKLPGYVPPHKRKKEHIKPPKQVTVWKAWQKKGIGRESYLMVSGQRDLVVQELTRPVHTSCRPGARIVLPTAKVVTEMKPKSPGTQLFGRVPRITQHKLLFHRPGGLHTPSSVQRQQPQGGGLTFEPLHRIPSDPSSEGDDREGARRVSFHANTFAAPEVEDEDVWDPDGEDGQGVESNGKARARPGQDVKHWRSFAMPATTSESGWS